MKLNQHYQELQESYLFSDIAKKVADYQQKHPTADLIRLGIGDVTRPLVPNVVEAFEKAVKEQGTGKRKDQEYREKKDRIEQW